MKTELKPHLELLQISFMIIVAFYLRFSDLGQLSLYGDEDYSMMAVQGILSEGLPYLPSEMLYWRGAIYSYLAALFSLFFGISEFSIRLPSVIFGVLAVPCFYFLAKRCVGYLPSILSTWLLVFSVWHIDMSKEARMYSMFMTLFILTALCFSIGFFDKKKLFTGLSVLAGLITITIHQLGILVIIIWLSPVFLNIVPKLKEKISFLTISLGLGIFWVMYRNLTSFKLPKSAAVDLPEGTLHSLNKLLSIGFFPKFDLLTHMYQTNFMILLILVLLLLLFFFFSGILKKNYFLGHSREIMGYVLIFSLAVINLFGIIALILLMLLIRKSASERRWFVEKKYKVLVVVVFLIFSYWIGYGLFFWQPEGLEAYSKLDILKKVVKDSIYYPALHLSIFFDVFPLMTIVVSIGSLIWLATHRENSIQNYHLTMIFCLFWIPLFILGFKREWIYMRFTVSMYPFYLMIFSWSILYVIDKAISLQFKIILPNIIQYRTKVISTFVLTFALLIFPFMNEHHSIAGGLLSSRLTYGQHIPASLHGYPMPPDHKTPGIFVKNKLKQGDIVIALDVFQQYFYIGKVDYWLAGNNQKYQFCYKTIDAWLDIYTNTPTISHRDEIEEIISMKKKNRVWLITSGQLSGKLQNIFSDDVINFFRESSSRIVFTGLDNQTKVYLFTTST